jgi:hypothetical protein
LFDGMGQQGKVDWQRHAEQVTARLAACE